MKIEINSFGKATTSEMVIAVQELGSFHVDYAIKLVRIGTPIEMLVLHPNPEPILSRLKGKNAEYTVTEK